MRRLFTLSFILFIAAFSKAQVVINEYSCSNLNSYADAFGQYEDWVELYNAGGTTVNLAGYWLSDDANDIQKYAIPAGVTIAPGARRMIFCSDRDLISGVQIHTSFKLKQTMGEKFVFADPAGNILDSTSLFLTYVGHSRGRTTDGAATWSLFDAPTPNAANANAKNAYAPKPAFNIAPGNYSTTQNITLSAPGPNISIRYTINGTDPTTASTLYAGPIAVSATTVIKARAFSTDPMVVPSFIETNTYLINETTTVNVISLTGNYTGLFGSGQQQYSTFEYFDKNHIFKFEVEGQVRRHGNDSWQYPQKGVRFHVKDESGVAAQIAHPLFSGTPKDSFGCVILKAAGSDNYDGNGGPSAHMRDAFAQTLSFRYDLEMDGRKYEPTIIYINGQYWGLYEIRERVDDEYTNFNYGQPEKKIDVLRYWGGLNVEYGSDTGWNNLYNYIMANSMAVPNNYNHVTDHLDVNSFIQYFIFNQYLVNTDWLNWNTMWWRGRKNGGVKWRYVLWDEDNILDLGQNYTGVGNTTFQNDPCDPLSLFQNDPNIKHTDMLTRLMQNPDFSDLYKQTWIDMLNGPFKCENILYHFDSIHAIIAPEMQRQCTRWGANFPQWQANVTYARNQIAGRCAVIIGKIDTCLELKINQLKWNVYPPNVGEIDLDGTTLSPYPGMQLVRDTTHELLATSNTTNWIFDHWEKTANQNTFTVNNQSNPVTYDFSEDDSITAVFVYFNPDSIEVTFDVDPATTGTISLNGGAPFTSYPTTVTLNRTLTYTLTATPIPTYGLVNWEKKRTTSTFAPDDTSVTVSYTFNQKDTVIAHFAYEPDPDSIDVTFIVDPPNTGTITLNGTTIANYPTTITLDRSFAYSLLAQPTAIFHEHLNWTKAQASSTFAPDDTSDAVTYNYQDIDTVIAHFVPYPNPDSVYIVFDVYPPGKGTIHLNGTALSSYPYGLKLDRRYAYDLKATPIYDWKFIDWDKRVNSTSFSPSQKEEKVSFRYMETDSLVAFFTQLPPPVDETIMIPSAFTPNGDGTNDVFRIVPGKDVKSVDFRIFNRFGELVFSTKDPKDGWDGTWKGQPAEVSTYFYQVKVQFQNVQGAHKEKMFKGDLTLVR
jgi:gliding motility-associated-like protein